MSASITGINIRLDGPNVHIGKTSIPLRSIKRFVSYESVNKVQLFCQSVKGDSFGTSLSFSLQTTDKVKECMRVILTSAKTRIEFLKVTSDIRLYKWQYQRNFLISPEKVTEEIWPEGIKQEESSNLEIIDNWMNKRLIEDMMPDRKNWEALLVALESSGKEKYQPLLKDLKEALSKPQFRADQFVGDAQSSLNPLFHDPDFNTLMSTIFH